MSKIIVIAHNIRSTFNVGSIFRSCEGFGVEKIILSGYTPYPDLSLNATAPQCALDDTISIMKDSRLPHIKEKITKQIHKTALGAESLVPFLYENEPKLTELRTDGYRIVALEQSKDSINSYDYTAPEKIALILGEEVHGIPQDLLSQVDETIEIPMVGKKESFNVSVATGIALYQITKPIR